MRATVSAQDIRKYRGMWLSIVGNFFVHKNSIHAHHAEHADRSLVSEEFESVYFFKLRRILHLAKLGHSKRDCENCRI